MCVRALQIGLAIPGIWLIYAGGMPEKLLQFKLKERFPFRPEHGKLFGLMLISPFPVSFIVAVILQMIFGEDGQLYGVIAQTIITVLITIVALIIARVVYVSIDDELDVHENLFPHV